MRHPFVTTAGRESVSVNQTIRI